MWSALLVFFAAAMGAASDDLIADYVAHATGTFSSEAQHREDERYAWAEARAVRIWPERTDGVWIYQEQAIVSLEGLTPSEARARPYFQFVARLTPISGDTIRRDNFRVLDGSAWLNITEGDERLDTLSTEDLAPASCHNRVERVSAGHYMARTETCDNSYRGAASMLSLALLTPERYVNWDRGFDADGSLVWGPSWGGYRFDRIGD